MQKTINISARISHEDAEFIAALDIPDAATPSDKIRHLIRDARQRYESKKSYDELLRESRQQIEKILRVINKKEMNDHRRSELILNFADWLTEVYAFFMNYAYNIEDKIKNTDLEELENNIALRVFRLLENTTRLGVTQKAPCYNPDLIHNNIGTLLELIELTKKQMEKKNG